ncbi:RNA polymerase sigma factor [Kineococcus glutinatus]|uniref:RNA polymerase sigma factor n=1 Tax=Kineococcus glutinatus TaxID=1070872 RepID=A0ABP9I242_9ACTN
MVDADAVGRVFRAEHGRCVATLTRLLGDIDLAEEAVQDAFTVACERWQELPPNPGGWIVTTARRRALDRWRRESTRHARHVEALRLAEARGGPDGPREEGGAVHDDRLRMVFTCCHPALAPEAQVALTLKLLGGLDTAEIARAFLLPEATLAQRIVRAKRKIRDAGIPYRVPTEAELPGRLGPALAVVYLVYTAGHSAAAGDGLHRVELCAEAVRLARLLAELMPDEPEVLGLLALLLLLESRRPARTGPDGGLVLLPDQDRGRWDAALAAEGRALVRACLRRGAPGPYQVQAAINAVHSDAAEAAATDWPQIVRLYDLLLTLTPTPVVALNRAVALAEADGPAAALAEVDRSDVAGALAGYQPWWVVRAELLVRLGRTGEAAAAYRRAVELTGNAVEREHLARRLAALGG